MKAVRISRFGHADVLEVKEIPSPEPKDGQVLIEVYASSINPFDTSMREGRAKPALPSTLGSDVAGVVKRVAATVTRVKPGDKVYGQANVFSGASGAFAEEAVTNEGQIAPMPKGLSFRDAASLPLAGLSALQVLGGHMKLQSGQKILIHGAAGGIGSLAVQLAKHLGAAVTTTASGPGLAYVRDLGADEVIDYKSGPFENGLSNFDAVFDTVAGDTYARSFQVLRRGGIIVSMLAQPNEELMAKFGVIAIAQQTRTSPESLARLTELIEQGAIKPQVGKAFPLSEIREAFEAREQGHVLGKVVVEIRA